MRKVKDMKKLKNLSELAQLAEGLKKERSENKRKIITICAGTGCQAYGCEQLIEEFKKEIRSQKIEDKVEVRTTGCHGFCERGPIVVIQPQGLFYQQARIKDAKEIISETILKDKIIERLLYTDPNTDKKIPEEHDVPFYKRQMRLVFGKNGMIDPTKIEDYIAIDGYSALAKVLKDFSPEQVIEEVKKSGLRGRGGAGFPTGVKWQTCRASKGDTKYLICNADEGDPGAYMDRSLLEGNPHSVIEGMIIGAYAIGATEGYIYVRKEYPLAVKNATTALKQAREYGLLGEDILGTGFNFHIKISKGAGAFVCGEETALMASIEGRFPEPRQRPPYPAQRGLWGKPTNFNNVETWANVPLIVSKGADWYSSIGTKGSKGTKIFSLVGKINNTGLVEVPMGIKLREIIYEIGGGIPKGKEFKAVQTGGPSGGCIPKEKLDLTIDFESLTEAGSMMGSGGMIVMDEMNCMVDVARYFLNFLVDESCGKCYSCRKGIQRMLEIVTDITEGKGKEGDIELLEELANVVRDTTMCGLGQTSANPVLSTIRYFRDEYEAHIKEKRCPAGVCKALITYNIIEDKCTGCGACLLSCPSGAITGEKKELHLIDQSKCIKCGSCYEVCKFDAVKVS
jgi:NADH:ubiquinone oxidoreductase subunit F (NADH-binding)/(2Fe-2S) ferredoxin/ferredoxin